ncbi:MAG: beta-propeller fold lactonase family protein [Thermoanaerobaculales bacterium]|jgi:YVTN family beta-propeller protein|nr:beta-propeller fold lactonase family protein [Thermoanaerobaculales bacterium]
MLRSSAIVVPVVVCLAAAGASAGTLVVANKAEATASLVDTETGEVLATLPTGAGPHEVAVSPDGRLALVGNYGTKAEPGSSLTLLDVVGAEVVKTIELAGYSRPHGIVWRNDRIALVTAEDDRLLLAVDVSSGKVLQAVDTGAEISHMVATAPGGAHAFVANIGSGSVTVVDLALGRRVASIATGAGAEGVAVTPDQRQVWVTNRAADTVTVISVANLERIAELEAGSFPIRAEATGDGRWVLVTNAGSNDLSVFSTKDLAEVRRIPFAAVSKDATGRLFSDRFGTSSVPIGIEIVDAERRAYVAHANADGISIVDLEEWKVIGALAAGREPDGMGWSPLAPEGATPEPEVEGE